MWTHGDKKRVLRKGLTWKQQTLLLLLTEADDVAESHLFRWLEHPGLPSFRKDVLKQLHKDRLIEYDLDERTVRLLATRCDCCRGGWSRPRSAPLVGALSFVHSLCIACAHRCIECCTHRRVSVIRNRRLAWRLCGGFRLFASYAASVLLGVSCLLRDYRGF